MSSQTKFAFSDFQRNVLWLGNDKILTVMIQGRAFPLTPDVWLATKLSQQSLFYICLGGKIWECNSTISSLDDQRVLGFADEPMVSELVTQNLQQFFNGCAAARAFVYKAAALVLFM